MLSRVVLVLVLLRSGAAFAAEVAEASGRTVLARTSLRVSCRPVRPRWFIWHPLRPT